MSEETNKKAKPSGMINHIDPTKAKMALERITPILETIPISQVRPLRVSVPHAVGTGLAYAQYFARDRELFEKAFFADAFNVSDYDNMKERAKAFWYADISYRHTDPPQAPIQGLTQDLRALRTKLLDSAVYLWKDHPKLGHAVAQIRGGAGRVNYADDLGALAALFTEHWNEAKDHCNVTETDVQQADLIGTNMLLELSLIQREKLTRLRTVRSLAGEYLRRGIEDIRAGATFVHRNDEIALEGYVSMFFLQTRKKRANGNGKSHQTGENAAAESPIEHPIPKPAPIEPNIARDVP